MKAILVINEMPKNCYDCPCWQSMKSYRTLDGQVFHNWCKAFLDPKSDDTGCKGMMTDEEVKTKPSWCPLKPMSKRIGSASEYGSDEVYIKHLINWKKEIDEILGDEE